eukprot:Colp12_sorted_trinity150504_noHs@8812
MLDIYFVDPTPPQNRNNEQPLDTNMEPHACGYVGMPRAQEQHYNYEPPRSSTINNSIYSEKYHANDAYHMSSTRNPDNIFMPYEHPDGVRSRNSYYSSPHEQVPQPPPYIDTK